MSIDLANARATLQWQGISVGVVALVASAALVFANALTQGPIAEAEARDLQASLAQVLPAGFADNDLLKDTMELADADGAKKLVYLAKKNGSVAGAVFRNSARGYSGDIVVLMGVDAEGRTLGVRVVKHTETPGLGDKIELAKAKSLANLPVEKWAVKKDGGVFDQFAGATITPRAVVKAVKGGLDFFAANRGEILEGKSR
jgi:electron transport complex protein RnfG